MVRLIQFPIGSCSSGRCSRSIFPPRVRNWEQLDEHIHVEDSLSQEPAQILRIPQKEGGGDNSDPPAWILPSCRTWSGLGWPRSAPTVPAPLSPSPQPQFPLISQLLPGSIKCFGLGAIKWCFMGCQVFCT